MLNLVFAFVLKFLFVVLTLSIKRIWSWLICPSRGEFRTILTLARLGLTFVWWLLADGLFCFFFWSVLCRDLSRRRQFSAVQMLLDVQNITWIFCRLCQTFNWSIKWVVNVNRKINVSGLLSFFSFRYWVCCYWCAKDFFYQRCKPRKHALI